MNMQIGVHFGEMNIMDPTGHTKVTWDAKSPEEVKTARKTFNEMKKKGYSAFRIENVEAPGKRIEEFDPKAEKMILIPQLVGG